MRYVVRPKVARREFQRALGITSALSSRNIHVVGGQLARPIEEIVDADLN